MFVLALVGTHPLARNFCWVKGCMIGWGCGSGPLQPLEEPLVASSTGALPSPGVYFQQCFSSRFSQCTISDRGWRFRCQPQVRTAKPEVRTATNLACMHSNLFPFGKIAKFPHVTLFCGLGSVHQLIIDPQCYEKRTSDWIMSNRSIVIFHVLHIPAVPCPKEKKIGLRQPRDEVAPLRHRPAALISRTRPMGQTRQGLHE